LRRNPRDRVIRTVGIVVPVHDEEDLLPDALQALDLAIDGLSPSISCRVVLVIDSCGDASWTIAGCWAARRNALVVRRECKSVGLARRSGFSVLLARWPEVDLAKTWLATTDADSRVPPDWLSVQVDAYLSGIDLWAGRIKVSEESGTVLRWTERYAAEQDPIHGASLGFSAARYEELGGFGSLLSGEDRDLYERAVAAGLRIRHDSRAIVVTSSRRKGRAPRGFAGVLRSLDQQEFGASA
jgi:hypothetical protein